MGYEMTKYIFITGGVVSSLGKGIIAASLEQGAFQLLTRNSTPILTLTPVQ